MENWHAQLDELQALEAIYEGDFSVRRAEGVCLPVDQGPPLDATALAAVEPPSEGWQLVLQLLLHASVPENGCKVALAGPHTAVRNEGDSFDMEVAEGSSMVYQLAHLPPIALTLTFGPDYPAEQAPLCRVAAMWLSKRQSRELEAELASLWQAQGPGLPVGYTWAEWLQTSALNHLTAEHGGVLVMEPNDNVEERESQGSSASDDDIDESPTVITKGMEATLLPLLQYSAARQLQNFKQGTHTCAICFEEQLGAQFARLDCGHAFCAACMRQSAQVHVASGELDALRCPDTSCRAPLDAHILRQLLDAAGYERWEQLTLQRALDRMADAAYCPRCGTVSLEDLSDNCADCPRCFFVFCTLCNEGRHPGVQCVSAETRLAMLRRKAEGGGAAAVEELRRKEHDFLSLAEIEKSSKRCPGCGTAIQRTEGCNKMSCANCGAFFCWRCNKQIEGYTHFKAGSECVLFDEAEILRWERRWEAEVGFHAAAGFRNDYLAAEAAAGGGGEDGEGRQRRRVDPLPAVNCPCCGQLNYKLARNNHARCWSCSRHFCCQCRTVLQRKGGTHFGPGGCKQHS